jgi:hypothetical protein
MNWCAGPQNADEECEGCDPIGVFGIVPRCDPRFMGGHVDARGIRHDPVRHEDDCPVLAALLAKAE